MDVIHSSNLVPQIRTLLCVSSVALTGDTPNFKMMVINNNVGKESRVE